MLLVTTLVIVAACGTAPPAAEEVTIWRPLGAWSGRGLLQTDAFISNTGLLRLTWEARGLAAPETGPAPPGLPALSERQRVEGSERQRVEGTLRISVHSDVSGRLLAVAVDQRGAGRDVTYVNEDPRSFFLVIESANLDWSVDVAEGIPGRRGPDR